MNALAPNEPTHAVTWMLANDVTVTRAVPEDAAPSTRHTQLVSQSGFGEAQKIRPTRHVVHILLLHSAMFSKTNVIDSANLSAGGESKFMN